MEHVIHWSRCFSQFIKYYEVVLLSAGVRGEQHIGGAISGDPNQVISGDRNQQQKGRTWFGHARDDSG